MNVRVCLGFLLLVVLAGCAGSASESGVAYSADEFLFVDVVSEQIPAPEITFFGVRIGDSEELVRDLHGAPDVEERYALGRVANLEYSLGSTSTVVLYHVVQGEVTSVLVTRQAQELLERESALFDRDRSDVYALLGVPTLSQDLALERVFLYDELGYDVYLSLGSVDRVYFTSPRGLEPVGRDTLSCERELTYAQDPRTGECLPFPSPCTLPTGWDVVNSCEQATEVIICVEGEVEARNPATGSCELFSDTCDVPADWSAC